MKQQLIIRDKSFDELKSTIRWLVDTLQDNQTLKTKDGKAYTTEMKVCVMELLDNNVSACRVGETIEMVLALANLMASDIPSNATVLNYNVETHSSPKATGRRIAQRKNLSLLTDETNKFGDKYMGYHVAGPDGNLMVLGLREIEAKSAKDTLQTYKEILQDIDNCSKSAMNEASMKILLHTIATMSDRADTEVKFNELLRVSQRGFARGSQRLQHDNMYNNMYNFFCGLHSLVHIAEASSKALMEAERGLFDGVVPQPSSGFVQTRNEPGAFRLVPTSCKAFARGADEKSGCHGPFSSFIQSILKQHKMHSLPLTPYRGSRFNILFENASYVFFFHQHMISFLEGNNSNNLLKAVLEDLKTPEFVAGCKALGLISCLITTPL